ncbi:MAG: M48 family metalloprotease [Longimicrobiales bacterium]
MPRRDARIRSIRSIPLTGLVLIAACAVNPATGRRQLSLISESREIEIGREADGDITSSLGLAGSPDLQDFVRGIGADLAARSERPNLPWSFKLVDDPAVNAFALPGGFIFVTRGILASLNSEAELAGVLGHEIGHVTAKHSVSRMSRQQLQQIGLGVGMAVSSDVRRFGDVVTGGFQLLNLSYSRGDESQSDELGIRYMTRAGYDLHALGGVFRTLALVAGGEGRVPQWRSTHPDPENREVRVEGIIAESGQDYSGFVVEGDSYLRRLQGLMYGSNPREGYFRGVVFKHPELAFTLRFPAGWRGVNQKTQVVGVSPREDAVLVLSIDSDARGVERALDDFLSQTGMVVGRVSTSSIGGFPAARAPFRLQSADSSLEGDVAFVDYGGAVYRLIGYGQRSTWDRHRGAVAEAIESFGELREPAALGVQPWRLEIVEVPSAMSFAAFMEAYPGPVEAEDVARLNRVTVDSHLEAGRLMKRVRGRRLR